MTLISTYINKSTKEQAYIDFLVFLLNEKEHSLVISMFLYPLKSLEN